MRAAVVAAALVVALVPAAEARPAAAKCARFDITNKAKPGKRCRKTPRGRSASAVRVAMTRGILQGPPVVPPVQTPTTPPPPPPATRLGVTAREWSLVLSRTALAAGPARVQLQNLGEDAHNLRLERVGGGATPLSVPLAEAGERTESEGTLPAGSYKVYCALPGHEAAGMRATLSVR